jgi:hypothetical protein
MLDVEEEITREIKLKSEKSLKSSSDKKRSTSSQEGSSLSYSLSYSKTEREDL